jgi:hypothetical protein
MESASPDTAFSVSSETDSEIEGQASNGKKGTSKSVLKVLLLEGEELDRFDSSACFDLFSSIVCG